MVPSAHLGAHVRGLRWPQLREHISAIEKQDAREDLLDACREALASFPNMMQAAVFVARVGARIGDLGLASEALAPWTGRLEDPNVLMMAARAHATSHRVDDGIDAAYAAFRLAPDNHRARLFLFNNLRRASDEHPLHQDVLLIAWAELERYSDIHYPTAASALGLLRSLPGVDADRLERLLTQRMSADPHPRWPFEAALLRKDRAQALSVVESALLEGWDPETDTGLMRRAADILMSGGDLSAYRSILAFEQNNPSPNEALKARFGLVCDLLDRYGFSPSVIDGRPQAITTLGLVTRSVIDNKPVATNDRQPRSHQKVLFLGGSLAAGGAEKIMAKAYRSLRERGHDVTLSLMYLTEDMSAEDGRLFYLGETGLEASDLVHVTKGDADPLDLFAPLGVATAQRVQRLYELLRKERPDVLHCWLDFSNIVGALAGMAAGVKNIVFHCHNMRPSTLQADDFAQLGWVEFYNLALTQDEITFVNCAAAAAKDYLQWAGRTDAPSVVIHNGFDFSPFDNLLSPDGRSKLRKELGIPQDAKVVGTALRFTAVKRPVRWLEMAIDVMRQREDVHVIMFGAGDMFDVINDLRGASEFRDRIHLPGLCSDIHVKLQALDVFALSSISEGLPNVLIEAQACGIPVVSYDIGGVSETMLDGVSGTLIAEDTSAALADGVLEWLDKPASESAREATIRHVRSSFSLSVMTKKIEELYSSGASAPNKPIIL